MPNIERRPVRVASWNLWWRFGDNWRARQEQIEETLAGLQVDVAGLQEVWAADSGSQAAQLGRALGLYSVFASPSLPPTGTAQAGGLDGLELGVAMLSRWPIRHAWTVRLPSSRRCPPIALIGVVDHPDGSWPIISACIEYDANLADENHAQARRLSELAETMAVADGGRSVLLMADLNAPPESPTVRMLTRTMVDAWAAGAPDQEGVTLSSANPFVSTENPEHLDRRIDYILARPADGAAIDVQRAVLAGETPTDAPPSDHYAVVADLAL